MSRSSPNHGKRPLPGTKKPRIEEPVSAGGVVYRKVDRQVQTVLCGRFLLSPSEPSGDAAAKGDGVDKVEKIRWSLAKGTPDEGETLEQTALREVREETGLDVAIEEPIGAIKYWFADRTGDVRYHKTVHFYLMVPVGGDPDQHDPEFDVVRWFDAEEALDSLTYANETEVLRQALELIAKRKGGG